MNDKNEYQHFTTDYKKLQITAEHYLAFFEALKATSAI